MAWRPEFAAPVVHQPEGFGGAPFRSQPYDQEERIPPSKPPRGQAPDFGKNALVFWRATIRHDLSHRADNSTRGNPTAACIEARGLDLHDAEQCRRLARAPVLDAAPRAAMRTFPAMITIYFGLGLNQLRLHRGENGLALGQAQPNGLRENHICRPVAGDHFASLNAPGCFRRVVTKSPPGTRCGRQKTKELLPTTPKITS